jgi:hypothetical protein
MLLSVTETPEATVTLEAPRAVGKYVWFNKGTNPDRGFLENPRKLKTYNNLNMPILGATPEAAKFVVEHHNSHSASSSGSVPSSGIVEIHFPDVGNSTVNGCHTGPTAPLC